MRRILLVMSVAALMAAMLAVTAVPAFATIHELVPSDDVANNNASTVVDDSHPPGITGACNTCPVLPIIDGKIFDNNSEQGDEALGANGNFSQPIQVVNPNALAEGEVTRGGVVGTNPGNKDAPGNK